MKFIKFLLVLIFSTTAFGQTFTAETLDIFVEEPKGNYFGGFKILSGVLKSGEEVAIYAETGRKFVCKINKIRDYDGNVFTQAKAGETLVFEFFTRDDAQGGKDYLRKGYKVFPKNFVYPPKNNPTNSTPTPPQKADFEVLLNGKSFKSNVTYKGASYWRKGVKNYVEKPYLQLSLGSIDSVDNRTLVFQIINPKESPATYSEKDMEVNFSGTFSGDKKDTTIYGFVNGKADTKFTVEITKWQTVSKTKAIISGKVFGELREVPIIGKPIKINKFENGVFENIEIEIFNEQQDLKEMMKEATKRRN